MARPSLATIENRLLSRARFRHMQVLVALAELGSLRRAAEAVGMTQPGVTKMLSELEGLLDAKLFHRHARGVRPTPECEELLVLARQTLSGVANTSAAVAARRSTGEGSVRIMGTLAALNGLLLPALASFNKLHPDVQVQMNETEMDDLLLATARGEVDIALCRAPPLPPEGWQFQEVLADEIVVVCGANHPLADKRRVKLRDLQDEVWLPGHAQAASRRNLEAIGEELGTTLQLSNVLTRLSTVNWWLLKHSRLLMAAPFSVFWPFIDAGELAVLKLDRQLPFPPLGMLLPHRELPPAHARLANYLTSFHSNPNRKQRL